MNRTEELIKDVIFGVKKLVGLDKENKQNHSEVISKIDDVSKGIKTNSETVAQLKTDLQTKIDLIKGEVDKKQTVYVKSEVKMPDEMSIKEPIWLHGFKIKTIASDLIAWLEIAFKRTFTVKLDQNSKRPDEFINVRLTNGKEHYEATGGGSMAGFGVPDALIENQTNGQQKVQSINELINFEFDSVYAAYPDTVTEVYTYKLAGNTMATITIIYVDANKREFISCIRT